MLQICEFLNFRDVIDCYFVTLYIPSIWLCFAFFLIGRQENKLEALEKWHTKVHNVYKRQNKKNNLSFLNWNSTSLKNPIMVIERSSKYTLDQSKKTHKWKF